MNWIHAGVALGILVAIYVSYRIGHTIGKWDGSVETIAGLHDKSVRHSMLSSIDMPRRRHGESE